MDRYEQREVNDRFWRDLRGERPSYLAEDEYAGNEAATRNTRYLCYLLTFSCGRSKPAPAEGPSTGGAA